VLAGPGLSRTAAQALGYKELAAHLRGRVLARRGRRTDRDLRTRQFAVRQLRWFQRDPRVRWVDIEHDAVAEAVPPVLAALDEGPHDDTHTSPSTTASATTSSSCSIPMSRVADLPELAQRLCDRRRGVGADGLLVGESADGYAARMTLYNADGSRPR
jgi:hypothetical protein